MSPPVSRVLFPGASRRSRSATIHLDVPLRHAPAVHPQARAGRPRTPARRTRTGVVRTRLFDLAPGGVYRAAPVTRGAGGLLHHRFTLTGHPRVPAGLFSVALSRGSRRVAVSNHPALWSPDFPRPPRPDRGPDEAAAVARRTHPRKSYARPARPRRPMSARSPGSPGRPTRTAPGSARRPRRRRPATRAAARRCPPPRSERRPAPGPAPAGGPRRRPPAWSIRWPARRRPRPPPGPDHRRRPVAAVGRHPPVQFGPLPGQHVGEGRRRDPQPVEHGLVADDLDARARAPAAPATAASAPMASSGWPGTPILRTSSTSSGARAAGPPAPRPGPRPAAARGPAPAPRRFDGARVRPVLGQPAGHRRRQGGAGRPRGRRTVRSGGPAAWFQSSPGGDARATVRRGTMAAWASTANASCPDCTTAPSTATPCAGSASRSARRCTEPWWRSASGRASTWPTTRTRSPGSGRSTVGVARHLAAPRVTAAPVPIEFDGLDGQRLPLPDASVDCALLMLTLCSIPDQPAAARELHRVLVPGGFVSYAEHGAQPGRRRGALAAPVERRQPAAVRVPAGHGDAGGAAFGRLRADRRARRLPARAPRWSAYLFQGIARKAG